MKPYGYKRQIGDEGCTCSLCRSRGYRKGNGFDAERPDISKGRARREGKQAAAEKE